MIILDLVEKLIDRLIQLAQYKQKADERLFREFVEPIFADLERIHHHYLQSFRVFRKMLQDDSEELGTVIEKIREEYIFSEGQLSKLREFVSVQGLGTPELVDFYRAIYFFLTAVHDDHNALDALPSHPFYPYYSEMRRDQVWFHGAIDGLVRGQYRHDSGHSPNTRDSIIVLDGLVHQLQDSYGEICSMYANLKAKLLR